MNKKLNKKALKAFAEKVKVPKYVRSFLSEADSTIKTVAIFSIRRLGEKILTTALFNEQGCFAVIFTRKSGEAVSYGIESGRFFKQRYIDDSFYGKDMAYINKDIITSFFKPDEKDNPISFWRRMVDSYRELQRDLKRKEKSCKNHAVFANLPPIPTNFKNWCRRDFSKITFDTADRYRGHCQYCDRDIKTTEKLVQGHTYKCPHCHHSFQAVSINGHGWIREKGYSFYCEMDGIPVIRHFILTIFKRRMVSGSLYSFFEYERDVLVNNEKNWYIPYIHTNVGRYEYWRPYKHFPNMWGSGDQLLYWEEELLYPYPKISLLNDKQKRIMLAETGNLYRWEDALTCDYDSLELAQILNAAGYSNELSHGVYTHYKSTSHITFESKPIKILGLNGNIAKLFREKQYGYNEFVLYNKYKLTTKESVSPQSFAMSLIFSEKYEKFLSALSLAGVTTNQISKYFNRRYNADTFDLWYDYINNYHKASEISEKKLIGKSWIFPPIKDLKKKHDEAVAWYKSETEIRLKKEREQKDKQLELFVSRLAALDNYKLDGMIAVLPHSYGDFVLEGTHQKNCVGGHGYFDAMVNAKSIIVFLRTKADESYCTCEFSLRGGSISLKQCRLKKNKTAPKKVEQTAIKYGKLLQKQLLLSRAAA